MAPDHHQAPEDTSDNTPDGNSDGTVAGTMSTTDAQDPVTPRDHTLYSGYDNLNPTGMSLWALWREDFATHERRWCSQGFWTLAVHRFGNWRMGVRPRVLRLPFTLIYNLGFVLCEWLAGISLPYNVKVGRRVKLEHFGGMILIAREIGEGCIIRQNTTFGVVRTVQTGANPIIEPHCDIGCGAVILGPVVVGRGSTIGANAVVVRDLPPGSVAVGVPAKVIKTVEVGG